MVYFLSSVISIIISPFYLFLKFGLSKALKDAKKKDNHLNFIQQTSASDGREIPFPVTVPRDLEIEFLNYRSNTYLSPMTWGVAKELALMITGENRPKPINIDVLCDFFMRTAGAQLTQWNNETQLFEVTFEKVRPPFWVGATKDVTYFHFNQQTKTYRIGDRFGNEYTPEHERWQTAMYHLLYMYSIGIPMGSHNWVHFAFPDTMASMVFTELNRSSVLYKLLCPHSAFTVRINNQALFIRRSTENTPKLKDTLTPWKCYPIYGRDFFDGVVENTANHYEKADLHLNLPDTLDEKIPYFKFLKAYYQVIENFVRKVEPHIDEKDLVLVEAALAKHMPEIERGQIIKYISIFIWQVSVVHSTEHASFAKIAKDYGFSELKTPITQPFQADEISAFNRFKFRCFLNTFVTFNPTPLLDQRLANYRSYQFEEGSELESIAKSFANELRELEMELGKNGETIVQTDEMVQSVCF